ncbi:MAG: putative bifunctional diguanylate cyclase/phosphodiesterase [Solirubrobacteraceae bacterium]
MNDVADGEWRTPAARLGDMPRGGQTVPAAMQAHQLEQMFADDSALSSVIVDSEHGDPICLTRGRFVATLTGPLGFGRALHLNRALKEMPRPVTLVLPAATTVANAAEAVLARSREWRYDDLVVRFEDGSLGTTRVADLFAELAHTHAFDGLHDELTGLPNRALFVSCLRTAQARVSRGGGGFAVLFVDVDDFKTINDGLGHEIGNVALVAVADRVRDVMGAADTAARLGGDEFAALVSDVKTRVDAVASAERVLAALEQPLRIGEDTISISASVGVVLGSSGDSAQLLLRNADLAMYAAKRRRKGGYAFYEPAMHTTALTRLELRSQLEGALERDEFVLVYQPIVELTHDSIIGVEALVRWHRPGVGIVGPAEFISYSEQTGLIVPIGRWVLHEACRQAERWARGRPGHTPLRVAVNISPRQLQDPGLLADVSQALADSGLDPSTLTLEITEGVFIHDMEGALERLTALKHLGVSLALDDFGSGFSSLGYLSRMPIDLLKLDHTFIAELGTQHERGLVSGVIKLARSLAIDTVAEGVEQADQVRELKAAGCAFAQGYYFAKPLDADRVTPFALQRACEQPPAATRPQLKTKHH